MHTFEQRVLKLLPAFCVGGATGAWVGFDLGARLTPHGFKQRFPDATSLRPQDAFVLHTTPAMHSTLSAVIPTVAESEMEESIDDEEECDDTDSEEMEWKKQLPVVGIEEVLKHKTAEDCWVVFYDTVYDLSEFLEQHPGGAHAIVQCAGSDCTLVFEAVGHSRALLSIVIDEEDLAVARLRPEEVGKHCADPSSFGFSVKKGAELRKKSLPPLESMLNVYDFERLARECMSSDAWAYYSSGADDEVTLRENCDAFGRVWLRPKVLVDVSTLSTECTLLGARSALPLYISATALGKLAHSCGETVLTRAAHTRGVAQMLSTLSSCSLSEVSAVRSGTQPLWFQLYVNPKRASTRKLLRQAEAAGFSAVFVTVDAPTLGRREKDMRHKLAESTRASVQSAVPQSAKGKGVAAALSSFIDPSLNWTDIAWIKSQTTMKLGLKGIQCGEDAVRAVRDYGVDAIVVSNHGGRQLDYVPSGIEMLAEVLSALQSAAVRSKVQVFVDGGFRRGADVYKALALGADAVGIGRPALYGMATFGQSGVERVLDCFDDELRNTMRLMGTPTLEHITAQRVDASALSSHSSPPRRTLADAVYVPMQTVTDQFPVPHSRELE